MGLTTCLFSNNTSLTTCIFSNNNIWYRYGKMATVVCPLSGAEDGNHGIITKE
jgi:hypothetical protein